MNGRHVHTTLIITLQDPVGIPPCLRGNVDYVFICKDTNFQNREKLYKMYAGMFPGFQLFEDTMLQCCDNYGCLVLAKNSTSYKLEDQVFWYKVNLDNIKSFQTCHPIYWQCNAEFIAQKQQREEEQEREEQLRCHRKNGLFTIVSRLPQTVDIVK